MKNMLKIHNDHVNIKKGTFTHVNAWLTYNQLFIYIYAGQSSGRTRTAVGKGGVHDIVCWWCQQKRSQRKMIQLKLSASVNRSKLGAILNIGWKCAGEQQPGKNKIKWMVGSFFFHLPTEIANN